MSLSSLYEVSTYNCRKNRSINPKKKIAVLSDRGKVERRIE